MLPSIGFGMAMCILCNYLFEVCDLFFLFCFNKAVTYALLWLINTPYAWLYFAKIF